MKSKQQGVFVIACSIGLAVGFALSVAQRDHWHFSVASPPQNEATTEKEPAREPTQRIQSISANDHTQTNDELEVSQLSLTWDQATHLLENQYLLGKDEEKLIALARYCRDNPELAASFARKIKPGFRETFWTTFLEAIPPEQASEIATELLGSVAPNDRIRIANTVGNILAKNGLLDPNPRLAIGAGDDKAAQAFLKGYAYSLSQMEPETALDWLSRQHLDTQHSLTSHVAKGVIQSIGPNRALPLIQETFRDQDRFLETYGPTIASAALRTDASSSLDFTLEFGEAGQVELAINNAFETDPQSTIRWLKDPAINPQIQDHLRSLLIRQSHAGDPKLFEVLSLADEERRFDLATQLVYSLNADSPETDPTGSILQLTSLGERKKAELIEYALYLNTFYKETKSNP